MGIRARIQGSEVLVGNHRLMESKNIAYCDEEVAGTNVHVARDEMPVYTRVEAHRAF